MTTDKQRYLDEMAAHKRTKATLEEARAEIRGFGSELADLRRLRDTGQFANDAAAIFQSAAEGTVGRLHDAVVEAMARLEELRLKTLDKMASLVNEEVATLRAENATLKAELSGAVEACGILRAERDEARTEVEPLKTKAALMEKARSALVYRLARHLGGPDACAGKTLNEYLRYGKQSQVNAFAIEAKVWLDEQLNRGIAAPEPVVENAPAEPEPKAAMHRVYPELVTVPKDVPGGRLTPEPAPSVEAPASALTTEPGP